MVLDKDQKRIINTLTIIFGAILICSFITFPKQQTTTENTLSQVEVLYTGLCKGNYGGVVVCGGVKNNSSEMLDVTVYTNIYNDSGVQIQDQVEWIHNIEPGNVAEFKGYPVPPGAHETKIVDVKYRKS